MELYDKLLKPITEVNYLRAENVDRYRIIIRYFYQEHEKIHYWMFKEDIYDMISALPGYEDYTMENCQNDLQALCDWGNLVATQDTSVPNTLQEFKNKKFRYQLSEYTVVIERMTIELEHLAVEGASLEPTLLERIRKQILQLLAVRDKSHMEVADWWRSLNDDFIRLNQNYQDYIKTLNSAKAEQMMKSREFLVFKDKLITYLQTFVKSLQEHSMIIEDYLSSVKDEDMALIFDKVAEYELSIPRINSHITKTAVLENCQGRWKSLFNWFVGENDNNEVNRLFEITNEIIRKITRYALQIGELHNQGANRKEEYRRIAEIFAKCNTMDEAHRLSALVFGADTCMHLKNIAPRDTDSIHSGVYQEASAFLALEPRTKVARKKHERKPATDYALDRRIQRLEYEAQREAEQKKIKELSKNGEIIFSQLSLLDKATRKALLGWVSKALAASDRRAKTDQGQHYHIEKEREGDCILHCEDGNLVMPCFKILFDEEQL